MTEASSNESSAVDWRDELQFRDEVRQIILSRKISAADAGELAQVDFCRIAILTALPGQAAGLGAALSEAAAAGAAAILSREMTGVEVAVEWPDHQLRRLPTGATALGPQPWIRAVACALLARDQQALEVLCAPAHISTAQLPRRLADDFWPFLCAGVAALVREPEAAASWLEEAQPLLGPDRISKGEPDIIQLQVAPIAAMARALATENGDFAAALNHALAKYHELYAHREPSSDPFQLVPLEALGLAALAFDRGYTFDPSGLPADLVRGDFAREPVRVTVELPLRRAELPEDPLQFLDLEGFPREGRKHTIVQRGDQLLAVYSLRGRPGIPRARASFVLQGDAASIPPALDGGDRVLLADFYAQQAGIAIQSGDHKGARSWLQQAVESLNTLLALIAREDGLPESAFSNTRSRRAREDEPGRFRKERLTAYRDALRHQLTVLDADETNAKVSALATAAVVKESLRPLLIALGKDQTGTIQGRLRPKPEDYEKVFRPEAVEKARTAYDALWHEGLDLRPPSTDQNELDIFVSPAGMFATQNELSRYFPGGYKTIGPMLQPRRTWAAWRYHAPHTASGLFYDGLVWCDDHWAWFPKPYRHLR